MSTSSFTVTLPDAWRMVDPADPFIEAYSELQLPVAQVMQAVMHSQQQPEFMAALVAGVADESGTVTELLMASLTAIAYDTDTVPEDVLAGPRSELITNVEVSDGKPISLLTMTIPVHSADRRTTVLMNFATPNLPRADEFEAEFRVIAENATVHSR